MFIYPVTDEISVKSPALWKKIKPTVEKSKIIPMSEVQTISPARHFKVYIKIKDRRTVIASPIKRYFQFYIIF